MAPPLASIGILSIGEMGLGIARLLTAHNFRVLTNISGRSASTSKRAESASISLVPTDEDLLRESDYILSIVPPRDAIPTANRIITAFADNPRRANTHPLYYLDLNAIAPSTARKIGEAFKTNSLHNSVKFIDGGIIGPPPSPLQGSANNEWKRPSIPISGPALKEAPQAGNILAEVLNTRYLSPQIGQASGLKACFASLTKGMTALAIQSFSTASQLGVLDELRAEYEVYSPKTGQLAANGIVGMPSKAYRWVEDMREIGKTFAEEGGWEGEVKEGDDGTRLFDRVAEIYDFVAEETLLGKEEKGTRKSTEEVVEGLVQGLAEKKSRT